MKTSHPVFSIKMDPITLSLSDAVAVAGPDGLILAVNTAFLDLLGYSEKEPLGRHCGAFFEGVDPVLLSPVLKDGVPVNDLDINLVTRGNGKLPASVSISPVRNGLHGGPSFILSAREIRKRKDRLEGLESAKDELMRRVSYLEDFRYGVLRLLEDLDNSENELEGAYKKLKETQSQLIQSGKMTALGELAAGLAHELNQPLTVIKGLSHNMLKDTVSSATHEKLRLIADASMKMEMIIRHLRVFSRADEEPLLIPVDMNKVVRDAMVLLRDVFHNRSIRIELDLRGLPFVLGSANRLEQVIINLAANSKDAMPGGGTLEISTEPLDAGRFVRVNISDTGDGIQEDIMDRIFDPFFTTKEPGKGTGLGLSISYGIIKEHGGDITVESTPGAGAKFHITLPSMTDKTPP